MYRQHNSPDRFLSYLEETFDRLSTSSNTIYLMGDFNVDLLKVETCHFAQNFLHILQSYHLLPLIDKPTRVRTNSATLIDNIFVNKLCEGALSGNITSDTSDHFSQFAFLYSSKDKPVPRKSKYRDYSHFSEKEFIAELSEISWDKIVPTSQPNVDKLFSNFYNKISEVVNKHAPLKNVSKL